MAELYGFSERSARRIAKAVKKLESMAGDTKRPAYTPEMAGSDFIVDRHVGTFTGVWAKDTTADVTVTADNGNTYTETATNYFADVGETGVTSDCVILQAGSEWVLVSASPVTETVEVVTDVECVNNSLVITTETLRVPKQDS